MTPRQIAVTTAWLWVDTPYHHRARVLGAGCDCLMLIVESYIAAGILPPDIDVPEYAQDMMFHSDDSSYVDAVLSYCNEVDNPQQGDIAMWKFGKTWSHGAIVLDWPCVIHAYAPYGAVVEMSIADDSRLAKRPARFFSPRGFA